MHKDEDPDFWLTFPTDDLALRCANLHARVRELEGSLPLHEIHVSRKIIGETFLSGVGIEVGAGNRPFPIPEGATCSYGDIRSKSELIAYFGVSSIPVNQNLDAQTLDSVHLNSLDFLISAHVVEHLYDPIGSIISAIYRLKIGGIFILIVPEMSLTHDRMRPPTLLTHLLADFGDKGKATKLEAYKEHVKYVHPYLTGEFIQEANIEKEAQKLMDVGMDIHVHAWRKKDFMELLIHLAPEFRFEILGSHSVVNENIFILKRLN